MLHGTALGGIEVAEKGGDGRHSVKARVKETVRARGRTIVRAENGLTAESGTRLTGQD